MSEQITGGQIAAGIITLVLVVGFYVLRRVWIMKQHKVLVGAAMDSYGITPADAAAAGLEEEVYKASARCNACRSIGPCRSWLAFGLKKRLEQNCPNLQLFRAVRLHKKSRESN